MIINERRVLCTTEKGYTNEREEQIGKLRAYFEVLDSGEIIPINSGEFFCETEQVFVTSGYTEIKNKFNEELFEAICIPTSFEQKDGNCKYVTRANSCEEIKGLQVCQIFNNEIPLPDDSNIIVNQSPSTKTIMLEKDEYLYGPFDFTEMYDEKTNKTTLSLTSITTPLSKIPQYHIAKIPMHKCMAYLSSKKSNEIRFISNIKKCIESADEEIDFITDDQIISTYGNKIAQSSDIRSFTKGTIAQIRKHYSSHKEYRAFPQRFIRLFQCLEKASAWDETRADLIQSFLSTDKGKEIISDYISENKEDFFKKERVVFLEQLEKDNVELKNIIEELKSKKESLESDIRKRTKEINDLDALNGSNLAGATDEQRKKIESQTLYEKEKLDVLINEIKALEIKHKALKKYENLEVEIKNHEDARDRARDKSKEMNEQVNEVAARLRESNEMLISKLIKLKPEVDALCGLRPNAQVKTLDYNAGQNKIFISNKVEDIREEIIDNVLESLNTQGRKTDYITAANILTTISQSQFTLFSGLPGTGKTSLAKMIGNSLGLKNRFLNIPIARGWTSSRDILGFYNALSQSFSPAATGLYELISHLDDELTKVEEPAAAIVLLDEFNLSQPEHYFSPFLEMSDPESKRILATGNPEKPYLKVPEYLRFIGTINQDESVQSLTPRLIDRAAIINFDNFDSDYDLSVIGDDKIFDLKAETVGGKELIEIFKADSLELPQDIEKTLQSIVHLLREDRVEFGSPIIASYRKIKAIRSFYNVAGPLMSTESRYLALDYAICQHIIPLLNGYGQGFGKRLDNLLTSLPQEMDKSIKTLKRILAVGNQNMYAYGYNL
ncbi:AAA family ATPase [Pantoea sp. C3]|uniref:AAA family ATPase n=1 Tax=Pantoea phytostimulans TaxID=2769024 RepID=UPI0038F693A8